MKKEEFSYDKAMAEMEKIVQKIESGDCKIDELTAEVKKAVELIALC
ncbi:MAG: exodeoxyribonuclease VII small subunit, partial [Bacteroidales bacterium]|nr:exodeoxyribonuclease VII small subunit [Bacteroidales bacterium]